MAAVDDTIDQLYGLPLAEFNTARNDAAGELRKAGQRDAAAQVKALRKPSIAAAAVNRLVRGHRAEVEQFLRAAAALRDAQFSGKGDLAASAKREQVELERLTGSGGEVVRQTLLAAAVDDDAARQLLEARLEQELEPRGFGTLLAHAPAATPAGGAAGPQAKAAAPKPQEPDDGAARAKLKAVQAALAAAEAEERGARRAWEQAQHAVEMARAAVEKAQRGLDRVHGR